jgi:hypothetical protein
MSGVSAKQEIVRAMIVRGIGKRPCFEIIPLTIIPLTGPAFAEKQNSRQKNEVIKIPDSYISDSIFLPFPFRLNSRLTQGENLEIRFYAKDGQRKSLHRPRFGRSPG